MVIDGDQNLPFNQRGEAWYDETLRPANRQEQARDFPQCKEGTRKWVFDEIEKWLTDGDGPNIFWLNGSPGAGKSAIASTFASNLRNQQRLGSFFFFRRGHTALSDPTCFWRTVARDLASSYNFFSKSLFKSREKVMRILEWPDVNSHFEVLIEDILNDIVKDPLPAGVPVVVLDGLDECSTDPTHSAHRKALLKTLKQWSRLPRIFKIFITSRRDEQIHRNFKDICRSITLRVGEEVDSEDRQDIRRFFEDEFSQIDGAMPGWPSTAKIDQLISRTSGLFIWAATVVKFIARGPPSQKLDCILSGKFDGSNDLDDMYRQILNDSFQNADDLILDTLKSTLATLVLAKEPLHWKDLSYFTTKEDSARPPDTDVKFILDKLSPVITIGSQDNQIRINHLSFVEFLRNHEQCPDSFRPDWNKESGRIALTCFQIMNDGLRFNIGGFKSSYLRNPVGDMITAPLSYACRLWAGHLEDNMDASVQEELVCHVHVMLHCRLLHWLEVLSLTKTVQTALYSLIIVARWIKVRLELSLYRAMSKISPADFMCPPGRFRERCTPIGVQLLHSHFRKCAAHLSFNPTLFTPKVLGVETVPFPIPSLILQRLWPGGVLAIPC